MEAVTEALIEDVAEALLDAVTGKRQKDLALRRKSNTNAL